MFFDQMTGPMGGMGGSQAAFTSPGMNPSSLAALMGMSAPTGGSMPPSAPMLPKPPNSPNGAVAANIPGVQQPQQSNILQMLMSNPGMLKNLFGGLGLGQGTSLPAGMPNFSAYNSGYPQWG